MSSRLSLVNIPTEAVTVLSSVHGRLRRQQRDISKIELKAAVKHGRREPGLPSKKDGAKTWKYTHAGVVYITDETSRLEITSWPEPGFGIDIGKRPITYAMLRANVRAASNIKRKPNAWTSHTVVVMDQSGSMRKDDTSRGHTRSDVVWASVVVDMISKGLVDGTLSETDVFSLIGMREESKVLIDRSPIDWILFNDLIDLLRKEKPAQPGNYIPALAAAERQLLLNQSGSCALSLLFLSDGKPSDGNGSASHHSSVRGSVIRSKLHDRLESLCSQFGRRLTLKTVAFGKAQEDFGMLRSMAEKAKRYGTDADFCDAVLSVEGLTRAFSSLTTSMTETRTEMTELGGTSQRTVRKAIYEPVDMIGQCVNVSDSFSDWTLHGQFRQVQWGRSSKRGKWDFQLVDEVGLHKTSQAGAFVFAVKNKCFGEGAERMVQEFRLLTETCLQVGKNLVAKQSRFLENDGRAEEYHKIFCQTQSKAQVLAEKFNKVLSTLPGVDNTVPRIEFLKCSVYSTGKRGQGKAYLVEEMLDPQKYQKWNNNAGYVKGQSKDFTVKKEIMEQNLGSHLDDLAELSDEESDEDDDNADDDFFCTAEDEGAAAASASAGSSEYSFHIKTSDIPQAFSHFTHRFKRRRMLVCDLQGVLDTTTSPPMFRFTDPVIHDKKSKGSLHKYGRTDKGQKGIRSFFNTHKCSELCKRLHRTWVGGSGTKKLQE